MTLPVKSACRSCMARAHGLRRMSSVAPGDPGPSTQRRSFIFDPPDEDLAKTYSGFISQKQLRLRKYKESLDPAEIQAEKDEITRWRADPLYRLTRSPERQCIVTRQMSPNGFMVNFRPGRVQLEDDGQQELLLLPDRVEHEQYVRKMKGRGYWTLLHRDVVKRLTTNGPHIGLLQKVKGLKVPPGLVDIVRDAMHERIVQELRILRLRLDTTRASNAAVAAAKKGYVPVMRLLSREDRQRVLDDGKIADTNAIALLDLRGPPESRTEADQEANAAATDTSETVPCAFDGTLEVTSAAVEGSHKPVPILRFPATDPAQLAELLDIVKDILRIEYSEQRRHEQTPSTTNEPDVANLSQPSALAEDALLVVSAWTPADLDPDATRRGQVAVPLIMALRRLRLFEGEGWETFEIDRRGRRVT